MKNEEQKGPASVPDWYPTEAELGACKWIAKAPEDRAMREPEPEQSAKGPDPTKRRPGSLSRSVLPILVMGIMGSMGSMGPSQGASVWGNLVDIQLGHLETKVTFYPTNLVLVTASGISAGPAITITATNGYFSNRFDCGDYVVSFPLVPWRKSFTITVPCNTNVYNITNLMTEVITYTNVLADENSSTILFDP